MRLFCLAAVAAACLAPIAAQAAEIQVFVPPVMSQGGVPDIAKAGPYPVTVSCRRGEKAAVTHLRVTVQ